jgi:hypothetical protein
MFIEPAKPTTAFLDGDIPTNLITDRLDVDRTFVVRFLLQSAEYLTGIKPTELEVEQR